MNIKHLKNISCIGISLCCVTLWAAQTGVKKETKTITTQAQAPDSQVNSKPTAKVAAPVKQQEPLPVEASAEITDVTPVSPEEVSVQPVTKPVAEKQSVKTSKNKSGKATQKNAQSKKEIEQPVSEPVKPQKIHLDGIKSVVFGKESTTIITDSDLKRPGLDGSLRSLDDIELEALMYQDASAKKMLPDEDAIDRHLNTVRQENNDMTLDQLKQVFKSAGYTYEEGRQQFKIMTAVNNVLDFMIRSRLLVPEKDVRAYYNEHPVYQEESYKIERAFVPFSTAFSADALYNKLVEYTQGKSVPFVIEWSPPFWVQENELAQDKKFITNLKVDQVSEPVEISGGFELFRLKEKREYRLQPLEERYVEIAQELRKPRYEKLFDEYKTSLFDSSSIVRFDMPLSSASF